MIDLDGTKKRKKTKKQNIKEFFLIATSIQALLIVGQRNAGNSQVDFQFPLPSFFSTLWKLCSFFLHTITILSSYSPHKYMHNTEQFNWRVYFCFHMNIPEKKSNKRLLPSIKRRFVEPKFLYSMLWLFLFRNVFFSSPLPLAVRRGFLMGFSSLRYFFSLKTEAHGSVIKLESNLIAFCVRLLWFRGWCQGISRRVNAQNSSRPH